MSVQPIEPGAPQREFGLIDVIESFTAMRQEFRNQATEGRQLADQLNLTTDRIDQLEKRMLSAVETLPANNVASPSESEAEKRQLWQTIADLDRHVSRTVEAAVQTLQKASEVPEPVELDRMVNHIDQQLASTSWLRRLFVSGWAKQMQQTIPSPPAPDPFRTECLRTIQDALGMLSQRASRMARDAGIQRIDVLGDCFDGELMNAIESESSSEYEHGRVCRQLTPAYRHESQIIRYADVHVSSGPLAPHSSQQQDS